MTSFMEFMPMVNLTFLHKKGMWNVEGQMDETLGSFIFCHMLEGMLHGAHMLPDSINV